MNQRDKQEVFERVAWLLASIVILLVIVWLVGLVYGFVQ